MIAYIFFPFVEFFRFRFILSQGLAVRLVYFFSLSMGEYLGEFCDRLILFRNNLDKPGKI
jgi:hypothetical protein